MVYGLYPLSTLLHLLFLRKTGRPLKTVLCRDTILFEVVIVIENIWYVFFLKRELDEVGAAMTDTLSSHMHYYEVFAGSPISQPYIAGFAVISASFRFFFALKATRVLGPFTKLIKINAVSLLRWVLVTGLILLFSGSCLHVLLS